ncbi:MAG TPA: phosphatidylinositol mannoside acyltransferase [Actinomycetota bacterium]|nr:phosphatidylinositol mannoside acyltransferase [Actinomycetota bacterium]
MIAKLRLQIEGIGWLLAWRIARWLPEAWVYRAFERLSLRSFRRNAKRRKAVETLLQPVVPPDQLREATKEAFRWYGRYWAETFRMADLTEEELDARFAIDGRENIEKAFASGLGGVLATLHVGNWDAGGRWVAKRWPLTVVVEVLRPRMIFDRFVEHRRALGMTIVPLERGSDPTGKCIEQLKKGEMIALVSDRDLSGSGVEVTMFGRKTKMPPGPAVLALRTGCDLIPAAIYQHEDGTWRAWVLPALERPDDTAPDAVAVYTQRLAEKFEDLIRAAPAQWHVFNRYWID